MLDPGAIRILTWNIHKEVDAGWQVDLARYAQASDILLLQEVVLQDPLRRAIEGAGLRWVMASSFLLDDEDIGVPPPPPPAPPARVPPPPLPPPPPPPQRPGRSLPLA